MEDSGVSFDLFLVEVIINGERNYVLCGRLDGPRDADSIQGMPQERIEALFDRNTLRAAPIRPKKDSFARMAIAGQSMDHVLGGD